MNNSEFLNLNIIQKQNEEAGSEIVLLSITDLIKESFANENNDSTKFHRYINGDQKKYYQIKSSKIYNNNQSSIML